MGYSVDSASGALTQVPGSPFGAGSEPYFVSVDPSGRFVYSANFFSSNISGFTIDSSTGMLTPIPGSPFVTGAWPGGITIDLSGTFLYSANFAADDASGFRIDARTGALSPILGSPFTVGHRPISVTTVGAADINPPRIMLSVTRKILWPPNGQLVTVTVSGKLTDPDSGIATGSVEYAVTDEYRLIQPIGHLTLDAAGNYSFTVLLRASREGNDMGGRQYMLRVSARDNAGNRGAKWQVIIVPHDRR